MWHRIIFILFNIIEKDVSYVNVKQLFFIVSNSFAFYRLTFFSNNTRDGIYSCENMYKIWNYSKNTTN